MKNPVTFNCREHGEGPITITCVHAIKGAPLVDLDNQPFEGATTRLCAECVPLPPSHQWHGRILAACSTCFKYARQVAAAASN
jgi:hypothetical protein